MRISAVIFDLFETLVDFSFDEYNAVLIQIAGLLDADAGMFVTEWHKQWPRHEAGEFESIEAYILCVSLLCNLTPRSTDVTKAAALHAVFERKVLTPRPQALETIAQLRRKKLAIGVVTNCAVETPVHWPVSRFAGLVDVTVFSTIEKVRKPQPEIFLICAQRLHLAPAGCVYVGDGANDELNTANSLGMSAVLLNNRNTASQRRMRAWNGHVVGALTDIVEHVEKLRQ